MLDITDLYSCRFNKEDVINASDELRLALLRHKTPSLHCQTRVEKKKTVVGLGLLDNEAPTRWRRRLKTVLSKEANIASMLLPVQELPSTSSGDIAEPDIQSSHS